MNLNYLFPSKYKRIGWALLIPSALAGLATLIFNLEPSFLDLKAPAIYISGFMTKSKFFALVQTNVLNEILGVFVIVSSILVAFSKEKSEDEYISKIRLESLVWAVYVNYAILLVSFLFLFDFAFLWVMVLNMFTILLFFIIRFHWQMSKLEKAANNEE